MFRTPRLRAPRQQKKGGSVQAAFAVVATGVALALAVQPAMARPHGYLDPAGQYVTAGGPVSLSPDDRAVPRSTVTAGPTAAYDSPELFIAGRRAAAKALFESSPQVTASRDGFDWRAAWIGASTGAVSVATLALGFGIVRRLRTHSLAA